MWWKSHVKTFNVQKYQVEVQHFTCEDFTCGFERFGVKHIFNITCKKRFHMCDFTSWFSWEPCVQQLHMFYTWFTCEMLNSSHGIISHLEVMWFILWQNMWPLFHITFHHMWWLHTHRHMWCISHVQENVTLFHMKYITCPLTGIFMSQLTLMSLPVNNM